MYGIKVRSIRQIRKSEFFYYQGGVQPIQGCGDALVDRQRFDQAKVFSKVFLTM